MPGRSIAPAQHDGKLLDDVFGGEFFAEMVFGDVAHGFSFLPLGDGIAIFMAPTHVGAIPAIKFVGEHLPTGGATVRPPLSKEAVVGLEQRRRFD